MSPPSLPQIRSLTSQLITSLSRPLVAVFVGGTAGIGSYAVRALAAHARDGPGLRLYILGRNEEAAERIIRDCGGRCPGGEFRFVRVGDLALLKEVDRACDVIGRLEAERATGKEGDGPRVDLLVMTQGILAFERNDTIEGLDSLMSLLYYSRMRFIIQLLPLLLSSTLPAHIISVFGPHRNDKIFVDDLSLRDPKHYGFMNMGSHVAYLTTFFMENLAVKYPGRLALIHYFPGLVITESFTNDSLPRWFRYTWAVVAPFSGLFSVPREESAERVLFLATERFPARGTVTKFEKDGAKEKGGDEFSVALSSDGIFGGGAYRCDWDGKIMPMKKSYLKLREEGMSERCWSHTMQAFDEIEAGKVFKG